MSLKKNIAALVTFIQHLHKVSYLVLFIIGQDISEYKQKSLIYLAVNLIKPGQVIN